MVQPLQICAFEIAKQPDHSASVINRVLPFSGYAFARKVAAARLPSRRQRQAHARLPQRVHVPLQSAVLPVQGLLGIGGDVSAPTYAELYA